ncbi:ELKS/Rab6-interacting/CAST family protein [Ornithobacterium rhinotracheale]|uniref:ELKS/Rab6-interacting/CAST family protein n=1 Tax=Ornithobacterium rhinotracheale TaxID=28251 RepID=UPI001FB88C08|nr:ELKS/Rab6-interacting/CAST family protein [Ornithobacterium rhinotracheale]UOH77642.1 ELKS/Rab6-interacting/CAST family protein [Ornithobacterium rhinotracheale]
MKNILSNIKERVLYLSENVEVTKQEFFRKIGITYGNFTGKKKERPLNSDAIENILLIYPETNPEWLLTGKGEMLKTPAKQEEPTQQVAEPIAIYQKAPIPPVPSHWERQVASLQKEVAYLQRENQHLQEWLKDKDKVIKALEEKESRRIQELEEEIARLTQENHAIKSQPQNRKTG